MADGVGLALLGGGIRSASFCLGACRGLADRRMFEDVDILSTVSNDGYTVAALPGSFTNASRNSMIVRR